MNESATLDRGQEYLVTPRYTDYELLVEERRIVLQEESALRSQLQAKQARAAHLKRRIDNYVHER